MDADPPEKRGRPVWSGEATDTCTRFGPSGYWARHVGKADRVIGGYPFGTRVAASTSPQGDGSRRGGSDGPALPITRTEHTAEALREFAAKSRDGAQVRRLLAIALILEGRSRIEAAELSG